MKNQKKKAKKSPPTTPVPDAKGIVERYRWSQAKEKKFNQKISVIPQLDVVAFARFARAIQGGGEVETKAFEEALSVVIQARTFLDEKLQEATAALADLNLPFGERAWKISRATTELHWIPKVNAHVEGRFNPMSRWQDLPVVPFSKLKERIRRERIQMPLIVTLIKQVRLLLAEMSRWKQKSVPGNGTLPMGWRVRHFKRDAYWTKRHFTPYKVFADGSLYHLNDASMRMLLHYLRARNGKAGEGVRTRGTGHDKAWASCLAKLEKDCAEAKRKAFGVEGKDSSFTTPLQ